MDNQQAVADFNHKGSYRLVMYPLTPATVNPGKV